MHYNKIEVYEMDKSVTINVRLTPQLKKDAEEVFDKLGLSMTNAIEIKNKLMRCWGLDYLVKFAVE